MKAMFGMDDALAMFSQAIPNNTEEKGWITQLEPDLLEKIILGVHTHLHLSKDLIGQELLMNRVASKEGWLVVKLLETEGVYDGREDAEAMTKKLRNAVYRAGQNRRSSLGSNKFGNRSGPIKRAGGTRWNAPPLPTHNPSGTFNFPPPPYNTSNNTATSTSASDGCFNCGKPGHIRRNCHVKRR